MLEILKATQKEQKVAKKAVDTEALAEVTPAKVRKPKKEITKKVAKKVVKKVAKKK